MWDKTVTKAVEREVRRVARSANIYSRVGRSTFYVRMRDEGVMQIDATVRKDDANFSQQACIDITGMCISKGYDWDAVAALAIDTLKKKIAEEFGWKIGVVYALGNALDENTKTFLLKRGKEEGNTPILRSYSDPDILRLLGYSTGVAVSL